MDNIRIYIKGNKKLFIGLLGLFLLVLVWFRIINGNKESGSSIYAMSTADSVILVLDNMNQDQYLKVAVDKSSIFHLNQESEYKKLMRYISKRVNTDDDA